MPELPEVEIIARRLREGIDAPALPGNRIIGSSIRWPRHIAQPSASAFRKIIRKRLICDIQRRGKFIVLPLDLGTMLIHLRMSGDLYLLPSADLRGRYEHTILDLENGWQLRFSDSRKFGKIFYLKDPQAILGKLGPEPLDPQFTADDLRKRLAGRKRIIKTLLMDQTFIAGLGNIYTDEALHLSGIHPMTRSDELSDRQIDLLWHGIRSALVAGLEHNGASIDWVYRGGNFQNLFRVYQRAGEACLVCSAPIQRIIVGQRGTHFCPICQPEKKP